MSLTFRTYSELQLADLDIQWKFANPKDPALLLEGYPETGLYPGATSNWDRFDGLKVDLEVRPRSRGLSFGSLLASRNISTRDAFLVLEQCSSLSLQNRVISPIVSDSEILRSTFELQPGCVPVLVSFKACIAVDGLIRWEDSAPTIRFSGDGTELDVRYHNDKNRPDWDWDIEFEDPYVDLVQEGLVVWIRNGVHPVHGDGEDLVPGAKFGSVQRMLWADVVCHILQKIANYEASAVHDLISLEEPVRLFPGSFVDLGRRWLRSMQITDLKSHLEDPPRLRRAVLAML